MRVLYTEWRTQLGVGGNGDAKGVKSGVTEVWKETQGGNVYMIKRHRKAELERKKKRENITIKGNRVGY